MSEPLFLVLAGIAGLILGAFFFAGLWWTVRKGVTSPRPAFWFLGSMLLRTSMILAGFYWVGHGHWARLVACLIGFIVARLVVTRLTGPPVQPHNASTREAGHAP